MATSGRSTRKSVKIINGALDEIELDGKPTIVMRGVVDPDSLQQLKVPPYQRETLSDKKIGDLMRALRKSSVPDIDLGVRGDNYNERENAFYLPDSVHIIDGLQRSTAAMRLMGIDPTLRVHLGALIHFGTTEEWERERFESLNLGQTKLSPNVTLRNQAEKYEAARALFDLSTSPAFPLRDKVTWTQSMRRGELITARTLFGLVAVLHNHEGRGGHNENVISLCISLERTRLKISEETLVLNVLEFFNVIDRCWGIRQVAYREGAVYLRASFMKALAAVFSKHINFWKEGRLTVDSTTLKKLASFPVTDPHIRGLSSSSGTATEMLRTLLTDHMNKGRRTGHLRERPPRTVRPEIETGTEVTDE